MQRKPVSGSKSLRVLFTVVGIFLLLSSSVAAYTIFTKQQELQRLGKELELTKQELEQRTQALETTQKELADLKDEDQVKKNKDLQTEITAIHDTYLKVAQLYEQIIDLKEGKGKGSPMDKLFATVLTQLSGRKFTDAKESLAKLQTSVNEEIAKASLVSAAILASAPSKNTPPDSGYSRQKVTVDGAEFVVDIIAADLNSTRVIVDTASDGTCADNCPVLPLATYVSRSGAFAGINGSYFCPESYPSCAGKKNAFDTLLMNKNKVYFNSDNNVYSTVPAAIFTGNTARFVAQSLEWGRDTGVDAVIANYPLLVLNGEIKAGDSGDPKLLSRGSRSFIGATGSKAYMGVVRGVSVGESAKVLKAMGMQHALNLDSGGSTALWFGGYKAGPGRNIPNAVLFVRK